MENSFDNCISLKVVKLSPSVKRINDCAFGYCKSLKVVKLPPSLRTINRYAFRYCKSLTIVNLSACPLLEEIDTRAFEYCTSLLAVYFPKSLESWIGDYVFSQSHSRNHNMDTSCSSRHDIVVFNVVKSLYKN